MSNSSSSSFFIALDPDIKSADAWIENIKLMHGDDFDGSKLTYSYEPWEYYELTIEEAIREVYTQMKPVLMADLAEIFEMGADRLPLYTGYSILDTHCAPHNLSNDMVDSGLITKDKQSDFEHKWSEIFDQWNIRAFKAYILSCFENEVPLFRVDFSDEGGQGDLEHGDHWIFINPAMKSHH